MWMIRINADGINYAINADSTRQTFDCLQWIFRVEVDDLGTLCTCHLQTGRNRIDSYDPSCIKQLRASNAELAHWAETKYGNRVSWLYLRILGSHICGRHNVGKQNGLIIANFSRKLY